MRNNAIVGVLFIGVLLGGSTAACQFDPVANVGAADAGWDAHRDAQVDQDAQDLQDAATRCGDGVRQGSEQCDGSDLGGESCEHLGYSGGTLSCRNDCTLDESQCISPENCGNGVLDPGEDCDDGAREPGDGCSPACRVEQGWVCQGAPSVCYPICGDGIVLAGEACDDGNQVDGDGCSSDCEVEDFFSCDGEPSRCVCRVLVDLDVSAPQPDGKTWATAYDRVQDGIDTASLKVQSFGAVDRCQVWVAEGTYQIYQGDWSDTLSLADHVDLFGGFCGTETKLSERPTDVLGQCTAVLDGVDPNNASNAVDTVVMAPDTGDATLDGFEISGGWNDNDAGGLYVTGSRLVVRNCSFHDNWAANGGAVFVDDRADVLFQRVWFENNGSNVHGGALYVAEGGVAEVEDATATGNYSGDDGAAFFVRDSAQFTLRRARVAGNSSDSNAGGLGCRGTCTVLGALFQANDAADRGGAVRIAYGGAAEFRDVSFQENQSQAVGGAVAIYDDRDTGTTRGVFRRCRFMENVAANAGGAVFLRSESTASLSGEFTDSLFYRNRVQDNATGGGAGFFRNATALLINCTVVSNRAPSDDGRTGGFRVGDGAGLEVHNSILWSNQGNDVSTGGSGSADLFETDLEDKAGNVQEQNGVIHDNPEFVDPGNRDFHLKAISPCLDVGDDSVASTQDLERRPRKQDLPGVGNDGTNVVDLGAFERQP